MSNGIISTIAGNGAPGFSGDYGPATSAQLKPFGVAVDRANNIYISEGGNNRIRKIDTNGTITTIAGNGEPPDQFGNSFSGDYGPATSAQLNFPSGVAVDRANNVYISDSNNCRVRKIDTNGTITTIAGRMIETNWDPKNNEKDTCNFRGDNVPATSAQLNKPAGVALDSEGNIYIADTRNNRIRKIDAASGIITTFAGNGSSGSSGDSGPATNAQLNYPNGVAVDGSNNVYISDHGNNRIRKIDTNGTITTIAGNGSSVSSGDYGPATSAQVNPNGVAVDRANNVYIVDNYNQRIRKIDAKTNIITTIAGTGAAGYDASQDGGLATAALLNSPTGVAVDNANNVYIVEQYRIRKISYPIPTTVPNTTMPNTTMPNTTMPNTTMPNTTMPNTTMPNTTISTNTSSSSTSTPYPPTPSSTPYPSTPSSTITPYPTSENEITPTTIPPFTITNPPNTATTKPTETSPIPNGLAQLHQYIASKEQDMPRGIKSLIEVRADDSKKLVMEQNNTLILGTMALAILTIGGIIIFDR